MYFVFSFHTVSNTHSKSMHDNDDRERERRLFDYWKKWLSRPNTATGVVPFNYIKAIMCGDVFKCHYSIPSCFFSFNEKTNRLKQCTPQFRKCKYLLHTTNRGFSNVT